MNVVRQYPLYLISLSIGPIIDLVRILALC